MLFTRNFYKYTLLISVAVSLLFLLLVNSSAHAEALLKPTQIQAIVGLLKSFGASDEVVGKVSNVLEGKAPLPDKAKKIIKKHFCPSLRGNLYLGKRGPAVAELQRFLKERGYYDYPEITGYFGPATERAVQKVQKAMKVVSSGTPETTGFGVVGPKTRMKIKMLCTGIQPLPIPTPVPEPGICTMEYAPVCGVVNPCPEGVYCLAPEMMKTFSNKCMLEKAHAKFLYSGKCRTDLESGIPSIHSFTGPVLLKVGEKGVWKISASDKSNQALTYSIDWGERKIYNAFDAMAMKMPEIRQKTSFEHSYLQPGTYTVTITVKNTAGRVARASSTVRVIQEASLCFDGNKAYKEGATLTCLQGGCIADAHYVCRSGQWKIEGGFPLPLNANAKLTAGPQAGNAPLTVTFKAEAFANTWTNASGAIVSVADRGDRYIDYGDENVEKLNCKNPTSSTCTVEIKHTYSKPGTYKAVLFTASYYGPRNDDKYGTRSDVAHMIIKVYGANAVYETENNTDDSSQNSSSSASAAAETQMDDDSSSAGSGSACTGLTPDTNSRSYPEGTKYVCGKYILSNQDESEVLAGNMCYQVAELECEAGSWKASY